jgi:hypothetical protein
VLGQTLFLIAMLSIFAASAAAGIAGAARAQTAAAAKALIVPGVETALARYQRYVAATIGAQIAAAPGPFTTEPAAIPALHAQMPWAPQHYLESPGGTSPLRVAVDVAPTAQTVPSCGGNDAGPDVAVNVQCSAFVQESRLSLALTSDAGPADASGAVSALAHGRYTVTLRLFAQPPYAVVTGVNDAADPAAYHEGDSGLRVHSRNRFVRDEQSRTAGRAHVAAVDQRQRTPLNERGSEERFDRGVHRRRFFFVR